MQVNVVLLFLVSRAGHVKVRGIVLPNCLCGQWECKCTIEILKGTVGIPSPSIPVVAHPSLPPLLWVGWADSTTWTVAES
jgi:hypothetical protein